MNHIRQVKQDDKLRSRLWRLLTRAEQLKLELCLEKVDLQLTFEPESKSEGAAEVNLLQLVPWKPPSEVEATSPVAPPRVAPPLPPPVSPPVPRRTEAFCRDLLFRLHRFCRTACAKPKSALFSSSYFELRKQVIDDLAASLGGRPYKSSTCVVNTHITLPSSL